MDLVSLLITLLALFFGAVIAVKIIASPLKLIFKLMLNAASGFLMLLIANLISGFFDFSIAITLITVLIAGCFGIPGVFFLVLLSLI